jgi:hypothetical protein
LTTEKLYFYVIRIIGGRSRGIYKGRRKGSKADIQKWIQKPKIAKTIEYLKKGYKANEISKIVGIHVNTITKVKKLTSL